MHMCRGARLLMDITSKLMPVRCGLLLVPSAALDRLASQGNKFHWHLSQNQCSCNACYSSNKGNKEVQVQRQRHHIDGI